MDSLSKPSGKCLYRIQIHNIQCTGSIEMFEKLGSFKAGFSFCKANSRKRENEKQDNCLQACGKEVQLNMADGDITELTWCLSEIVL